MKYKSLQTSDQDHQTSSVDVNNVINYNIDATENFETEILDVSENAEFLVIPNNIDGSGVLKYYFSLDKINWLQTTKDNDRTNIEFIIADDTICTLKDFRCVSGYRKFVWGKGTVVDGTITIKFVN